MLKNLLILILIIIVVVLGAAMALRIVFWYVRMALNLLFVIAAFIGVIFLIRKLRA